MTNEIKSECARKFAPLIEFENTSAQAADDILQLFKRMTANEKLATTSKGELDVTKTLNEQNRKEIKTNKDKIADLLAMVTDL